MSLYWVLSSRVKVTVQKGDARPASAISDSSGCRATDHQGKTGAQRYSDDIKHLWSPVSVTAKKGS